MSQPALPALAPELMRSALVAGAVEIGMLPWRLEYNQHDARFAARRTEVMEVARITDVVSADMWQSVIDTLFWRISQRANDEYRTACAMCARPVLAAQSTWSSRTLLLDVMPGPDGHWEIVASQPGTALLVKVVEPHKRRADGRYWDQHDSTCERRRVRS